MVRDVRGRGGDGPARAPRRRVPAAADGRGRRRRPRERYDAAIDRIHERIAAGDTYQVNHTLRLRARVEGDPRGLYRDLCYAQRGAYARLPRLGRYRVLSASPELFFGVDDGAIVDPTDEGHGAARTMAAEDDRAARTGSWRSAKDRAENAMIVDLLRNDLGRVSRTGSVTWSDVFEAERYETVWQLTSTVSAELDAGVGLADVFRGALPLRIGHRRAEGPHDGDHRATSRTRRAGVYCGAVGYLAPAGTGRAARAVQRGDPHGHRGHGDDHGRVRRRRRDHVGLDASAEYEETVAKARVLTARRPDFQLLETMRSDRPRACAISTGTSRGCAPPRTYFGFRLDEADVREAVEKTSRVRAGRRTCGPAPRSGRDGTERVAATPLARDPDPVRVAIDDVPSDPRDVFLFHKTTLRDRYEDARRPPSRRRRRRPRQRSRRGHGVDDRERRGAGSTGRGSRRRSAPGLLPGIGRAVASRRDGSTEGSLTIEDARGRQTRSR